MKPTEQQKKRVKRWVEFWQRKLFLHTWHIDINYPCCGSEGEDGFDVLADNTPNCVYLKAKINIYPAFFQRSLEVQEDSIVHELVHCHTEIMNLMVRKLRDGELVTQAERIEGLERLTQTITVIARNGIRG